jgi:hypothetical protein
MCMYMLMFGVVFAMESGYVNENVMELTQPSLSQHSLYWKGSQPLWLC